MGLEPIACVLVHIVHCFASCNTVHDVQTNHDNKLTWDDRPKTQFGTCSNVNNCEDNGLNLKASPVTRNGLNKHALQYCHFYARAGCWDSRRQQTCSTTCSLNVKSTQRHT